MLVFSCSTNIPRGLSAYNPKKLVVYCLIIPCSANMVSKRVIFGAFLFLVSSNFLYFGSVFNKRIIPFALVGYEIIHIQHALLEQFLKIIISRVRQLFSNYTASSSRQLKQNRLNSGLFIVIRDFLGGSRI